MTTDLKLPTTPASREALEAYFQAVAVLARRRELIEQAKASITEAEGNVHAAAARCIDLGLLPRGTGARRSPRSLVAGTNGDDAAQRRAARGGPTRIEQAVAAVTGGAATVAEVAAAIGMQNTPAAGVLGDAAKRGLLHRVKVNGQFIYSVTAPAETST